MDKENMMKPVLKWAGGKGQLLNRLKNRLPSLYNTYYEPFIGGGALLLGIKPDKAVINDINKQLINVYYQLKLDPEAVIKAVRDIEKLPCDKTYYLSMRERYNHKILHGELDLECAGLMIWINKHCFNGLYRVNAKGLFNVPYNSNNKANSIEEANLINIGNYLSAHDIKIECKDFEELCEDAKENDFVYFDSPYIPISKTASFTDYTKDGFTFDDHKRLAALFRKLDKKGVKIMLSNHDTPLIYELYNGYFIESIEVRRSINSDAKKRTGKEVIVTNYDTGFCRRK